MRHFVHRAVPGFARSLMKTLVPQTANISDNDLKSNDIKEENGSTKESG
jgi:hypothetical protein